MTIMISIKNGSGNRDVILESLDGKSERKGYVNLALSPGQSTTFTIWNEQQLLVREAMAGNLGVRLGDSVYDTLGQAANIIKKTLTFLTVSTLPEVQREHIIDEIKKFLVSYEGEQE